MEPRVYLDLDASTPIAPGVAEAMRPFLSGHCGNPSSPHWAGAPARAAVEGMGAVRFSLGRTTTWSELERVLELVSSAVRGR